MPFFFYLTFSLLEILMKNISEREKGLFSHHFFKMAHLLFAKVDFRNSFVACLCFTPHTRPSQTDLYFLWPAVLVFRSKFDKRAKTLFSWPKTLFFFEVRLFLHWLVYVVFGMLVFI
jgi:hypothetical protein